MVRDDQHAHLIRARKLLHAFADDVHGVGVEAAVGLVEDRELRLEHRHLDDLHPLLFAPREAFVEVAPSELAIDAECIEMLVEFLAELAHRDELATFLALGIANVRDRVPQEVGDLHAGDRDRVLERQVQTFSGPLVGFHLEHVLAVELDRAVGDFIVRMTSQSVSERAFARAVRTHQGMDLARVDLEIDPLEDQRAGHRHVQVFNRQRAHVRKLLSLLENVFA